MSNPPSIHIIANADDVAQQRSVIMASVLSDIRAVQPFSKSEKPSSKVPLVRSPADEMTEIERARRVSTENWLHQHYFFSSDEGKRLLELNYSVLSDVRRAYNQREAAEASLNEQMERIAKNSMTRVFNELEKKSHTNEVIKETELERQRRLDPQQWQREVYYFSSPEGQRAVVDHNDVLTDVRRIHNIKEVTAAMDLEQGAAKTRNNMAQILEQLRYNARAKEISRVVEEERTRLMEEGPATRFVRYNRAICQPFLPEIRHKRSFVEVC